MADHIKNFLSPFITQPNNWKVTLLANWRDIMGSLGSQVTLEKIHEDTLILGVVDSCWMQELYLLSELILRTINQKLDRPRIKQLRFKKVGIKKASSKPQSQQSFHQKRTSIPLSVQEQQALEMVKDKELKDALLAFLIKCYQEK